MTTLKLEDRKNTTEAGVTALKNLIDSFDFDADINELESQDFPLVADTGKGQRYVWSDLGYWSIRDGEIHLCGYTEQFGYPPGPQHASWDRVTKIDFSQALLALQRVIREYNNLSFKKDAEIETFLNFCKNYNK